MLMQANEEGEACSTSCSVGGNGICRPNGASGTSAGRGADRAAEADEGEDLVDNGSDFDVIPSSSQQPTSGHGARHPVIHFRATFHAQSMGIKYAYVQYSMSVCTSVFDLLYILY